MSYYSRPDIIGGAIDTATKMYGLLNAPEDRRRKQETESIAMETARLQQETARLGLDRSKRQDQNEQKIQQMDEDIHWMNGLLGAKPEELQSALKNPENRERVERLRSTMAP
jgi:uncharacterized membrane protein YccC